MPKDWIAALEAGATLVTASDRLSRHFLQHYADHQLAAGRDVWERPDILPEASWWRRMAGELQEDGLVERQLAGPLAVTAWWENAVSTTFRDRPLLQMPGAAQSALDAWKLLYDWCIDPQELAGQSLEEARHLHRWGVDFDAWCAEQALIPASCLPEVLLDGFESPSGRINVLPSRLLMAGFLELTPRQAGRIERLHALGCSTEKLPLSDGATSRHKLACRDAREEHRALASWAAERMSENPEQRIAIVVPDLAARRREIRRQLLDSLVPDWLPTFSDRPLPFNFSLGEPLIEEALVRSALDGLLAISRNSLDFAIAARLVRSSYIGVSSETPRRLSLERLMRDRGYAEFTLRDLAYLAENNGADHFAMGLMAARERFEDARRGGQQLPSDWARTISDMLRELKWCHPEARRLDSHEFQAREAFNGLLGRLAELDSAIGRTSFATVLGWLRRLATETLFQPRAVDAPVQVLGLFEATGMDFDAVWIAGLDDGSLPSAPHPNPFIPMSIQREHDMPQSSASHEHRYAEKLFDGLLRSAPRVICSFAERAGDAERRGSPLLDALAEMELPTVRQSPAESHFGDADMLALPDSMGPTYEDLDARGGTGLLQDQSACAFRAFATHRLRAGDWITPEPGPDALMRGAIVHDVMEALWRRWRTSRELHQRHAAGDLEAEIRDVVDAVVADSVRRERYRWRDSLAAIERQRLLAGVMRWVEQVELRRPEFSVVEIEGLAPEIEPPADADYTVGLTSVQAGPVRLHGKLDRVDRLADGSELIIDYKSGQAPSTAQLFGERIRAPQLPAYVVAREQAGHPVPVGVAVASLRSGSELMRGVVDDRQLEESDMIAGLTPISRNRGVQEWNEVVAEWKGVIDRLGREFANGKADVDPLPGACNYCHLATLCRIHEKPADRVDEEEQA